MEREQFIDLFNSMLQDPKYSIFNFGPFKNIGAEKISVQELKGQYRCKTEPFAEYEAKIAPPKSASAKFITYLSKAARDSVGFANSIHEKYDGKGIITFAKSQPQNVRIQIGEPILLSSSDTAIKKQLAETLESLKSFDENYKGTFLTHLKNWEEKGTL